MITLLTCTAYQKAPVRKSIGHNVLPFDAENTRPKGVSEILQHLAPYEDIALNVMLGSDGLHTRSSAYWLALDV